MFFNSICLLNKNILSQDIENEEGEVIKRVSYNANLIRKSKNNQISLCKLVIPKPNVIDRYSVLCFEGKENEMVTTRLEYSSPNINEAICNFKKKFKEKTGKDFIKDNLSEIEDKDEEKEQFLKLFPLTKREKRNKSINHQYLYKESYNNFPLKNQIPTFKRVCFSVIRELLLINSNYLDDYLTKLPIDLVEEFLKSCKYDHTPNGFYCVNLIVNKINKLIKEGKNNIKNNISSINLPRIDQMINLSNQHDSWFSFLYEKSIIQDIFNLSYNQDFLINVYQNYNQFVLKKWPFENQTILINSEGKKETNNNSKNYGKPSIHEYDQFFKLFNQESNYRFTEKLQFDWNNTVICGGFITMCLIGDENNSFQDTDIDIYYYGLTEIEIINKIQRFIKNLQIQGEWDKYSISKTLSGCIILSKHYPYRHIKFHLETYVNKNHILVCVDVNSCGFAYDGTNILTLYNSIHSINYRCNFLSRNSWLLNGDIRYQSRLIKYLTRGFSLVSYDLKFFGLHNQFTNSKSNIQNIKDGNNNINNQEEELFDPHNNHSGLALLVSCQKNNDVFQYIKSLIIPLPYGPDIKKEQFEELIGDHTLVSRFQSINESYLELIKSHPQQYPNNRKYSTLSSNMFPFINIQPRFIVDM